MLSISGYVDVVLNNDTQMAAAVARGPVSVAIMANSSDFQHYHSGVFTGSCGPTLDHSVLIVGLTDAYWVCAILS